MFEYDYTLDESGVTINEKSNNQQMANNLSKLAIIALVALCGYEMKLLNDPKEKVMTKEPPVALQNRRNSPQIQGGTNLVNRNITPTYNQNATNLIQNSIIATQSAANAETSPAIIKTIGQDNSVDGSGNESTENGKISNKDKVEPLKYSITGSPKNIITKKLMDILLTKYIADKLVVSSEKEILKILNSNIRNPYLIWDNGTRMQLTDFLEYQRTRSSKEQYEDITNILELVSDFVYDAHKDELQIGGIFIRIYNEMPTFPIVNPNSFIIDLLEFLKQGYTFLVSKKSNINKNSKILMPTLAPGHPGHKKVIDKNMDGVLTEYARSKIKNQIEKTETIDPVKYDFASDTKAIEHIIMALKALESVIKCNPNVEIQCIGHFEMLFGLLSTNLCEMDRVIKTISLEIVSLISRNKECVNEIAACEILGYYLVALKDNDLKDLQLRVLETLSGLINHQKMVKEAHIKGAVIYLLDSFCYSNNPQIREMCAQLLAKMTADKLSGPKVRITVGKFLPLAFMDAMVDSPPIVVQMFESTHEHPELIWNDRIRTSVCDTVRSMTDQFYYAQKQNPKHQWKDPDTLQDITTQEIVVSGVYLRLYVSNPGWTLRKPKQFLADLLDFVVENINRTGVDKDLLDLSTNALVALLYSQPNLADAIPVLGHIPKFFRQLTVQPNSALTVLHQLSASDVSYGFEKCLTFF